MEKFKYCLIIIALFLFLTSTMAWAGSANNSTKLVKPGAKISINPQPEPPGKSSNKYTHTIVPTTQASFSNPETQKASGGDNGVGEKSKKPLAGRTSSPGAK